MFKEFLVPTLFESIPAANKGGDCYELALRYMQTSFHNKKLKLVHGLVDGQGALSGITYNHAWVEDGNTIIDMTLPSHLQKSLQKEIYYGIGNIKTVYKYNHKEMNNKMVDEGTYGPWEPKLKKNKY